MIPADEKRVEDAAAKSSIDFHEYWNCYYVIAFKAGVRWRDENPPQVKRWIVLGKDPALGWVNIFKDNRLYATKASANRALRNYRGACHGGVQLEVREIKEHE